MPEPLPSPASPEDRGLSALRELLRAVLPQLALLGVWEYVVTAASSGSVTCDPADAGLGLPGGVVATVTPSPLGERVTLAVGSRCLLAFVNGSAGRPVVVGGDPSLPPTLAQIGGIAGQAGIARTGDAAGFLIPGSGGASWSPTNPGGGIPMYVTGGSATAKAGA